MTGSFYLPIKRKRDKSWKIESGKVVFTCFTSDFLLADADEWREECWLMMKRRSDLWFYFLPSVSTVSWSACPMIGVMVMTMCW